MSNSFNAPVTLGRKPEIKQLPSGASVLVFSAANNVGFGDKQQTIWLNCQLFGQRGEKIAPYLDKGSKVWVTGEMTIREYTGKDGTAKYSVDLNLSNLDLLDKKGAEKSQSDSSNVSVFGGNNEDFNDDIPF